MAKPLGAKALLIRDAIKAHPDKGNTELAEIINASDARKDDKIKVKVQDVASQRQAMKKAASAEAEAAPAAATAARRRGGKKPARTTAATRVAAPAAIPVAAASPVDLIDRVLDLAQQCGGFEQLKKLVDRLSQMQGRQ